MIRAVLKDDYIEMDAVFRQAAQQLYVKAYGSYIVNAWAGEPRPERFIPGAKMETSNMYYSWKTR